MSKSKPRATRVKIKIGMKVKSRMKAGEEGIVTDVRLHNPANPVEEHGMIEFKITNPCRSTYLKVGDDEHYTEYQWEKYLKVIV